MGSMRRTLVFIVVSIFSLCVVPPVFPQHEKPVMINVLVPATTSSSPLFVLAEKDPLDNTDIAVHVFLNHPQALATLYRGEAQFLFTGTSLGWENRLGGAPLVVIATGVWGVSYLIGNDHSITSFSQLKGKKISLPFPGSPLDFQTRYILHKEGIDPEKDLEISYAPFTQAVPMLKKGLLDAAPLPEPLATNAIIQQGLLRLIDYKTAWADASGDVEHSPQVSLFTTRDFSQKNRELITDFVDAWIEATDFTVQNPSEAARISSLYLSIPVEVMETAISNTLYAVPNWIENREMIISYYTRVKDYLPGKREELPDDFFFSCEK
jgi:ABC-type nitrate/sulfonate/bicarbonate transport system substrate-binding protein